MDAGLYGATLWCYAMLRLYTTNMDDSAVRVCVCVSGLKTPYKAKSILRIFHYTLDSGTQSM